MPLLQAERRVADDEMELVRRWTAGHASIRSLLGGGGELAADGGGGRAADGEAPRAIDVADGQAREGGAGAATTVGGGPAAASAVAGADASVDASALSSLPAAPTMLPGSGGPTAILPGMSLPVAAAVGQSAVLSQLAIVPGDEVRDDAAFPRGRTDGNSDLGQQLDLRAKNSWMLRLEEVSTPEMAEVLAINALAPAVINGRLRAFMEASGAPAGAMACGAAGDKGACGDRDAGGDGGVGGDGGDADSTPTAHALKFIVNVSAMEGRFYKVRGVRPRPQAVYAHRQPVSLLWRSLLPPPAAAAAACCRRRRLPPLPLPSAAASAALAGCAPEAHTRALCARLRLPRPPLPCLTVQAAHAPAHEHGQGCAQHDDADQRGRLREGAHLYDRGGHGLDQRREARRTGGGGCADA